MNVGDTIYDTKNYKVVLGIDDDGILHYQMVNKSTGVIEQRTTIWPNAYVTVKELDKETSRIQSEIERADSVIDVPSSELVVAH